MNVVLITDIFGFCESLDELILILKRQSIAVTVIDPYQRVRHSFGSEKEAYGMFVEKCGHDVYFSRAQSILSKVKPSVLIGFSAGANVVWRLSSREGIYTQRALCFYPTQIRHYQDLQPTMQMHVIFPHDEHTFDVDILSKKIKEYPNVKTEITIWEHGFMNKRDAAYTEEAQRWGLNVIAEEIRHSGMP